MEATFKLTAGELRIAIKTGTLVALVDALDADTADCVQELKKPAAPKTKAPAPVAEAPAPVVEEPAPAPVAEAPAPAPVVEEPEVDAARVKAVATELVRANKQIEVNNIIKGKGFASISKIPADRLLEVYEELLVLKEGK